MGGGTDGSGRTDRQVWSRSHERVIVVRDSLPHTPAAWGLVALILLVALIGASMRAVPEHQRVVVTRLGRVVRVVGPGLVWRVLGLERWNVVSLRPAHQMLGVAATTRDGVAVHVRAAAQCHVTDPTRSVKVAADPIAATFGELETYIAREVGSTRFTDLLAARHRYESDLPALVSGATSAWGVEVISLDIGDIEVLLTADLLHSLRYDSVS